MPIIPLLLLFRQFIKLFNVYFNKYYALIYQDNKKTGFNNSASRKKCVSSYVDGSQTYFKVRLFEEVKKLL
jgi:hypothetical protein